MATATVNVDLEGYVERLDTSGSTISWVSITRDAPTGTLADTRTTALNHFGTRSSYTLKRGTYSSFNSRSFFFFDLSSIVGTITAATLKVYAGTTGNSVDTVIVEATAWDTDGSNTTLDIPDYSALAFSEVYSSPLTSWTASAYNSYALNATAISQMNTLGYLNAALITEDYDQTPQAPTLGDDWSVVISYANGSFPQQLDITYTPAGYGNDVNGVASASIVSINGVATADIVTVNGI